MKATRPHITAPSCKDILNKESKYVKLLDVKSWDDITWKAEYDGNMQTAPSPYRTIHFIIGTMGGNMVALAELIMNIYLLKIFL